MNKKFFGVMFGVGSLAAMGVRRSAEAEKEAFSENVRICKITEQRVADVFRDSVKNGDLCIKRGTVEKYVNLYEKNCRGAILACNEGVLDCSEFKGNVNAERDVIEIRETLKVRCGNGNGE